MGNPLNYYADTLLGGSGVEGTLEWNGRQLSAVVVDGKRYEYSYNADGMRTSVKIYSEDNELENVYYYIWENGKLIGYYFMDAEETSAVLIKLIYDGADEPIGFEAVDSSTGETYYFHYKKNLQGDITAICEDDGTEIFNYYYDAWGKIITIEMDTNAMAVSIALVCTPITYRGYNYDVFTGLYYLQSRYYNPTYGRFLNADSIIKTGDPLGANIFAYCCNNPVNFVDYDGYSSKNLVDLIVEFIVLLIVIEVAMQFLFKNIKFDKAGALKRDWNGIYSIKMRYITEDDDKEWLTLEFGDYEAWKNSSFFINENTSMYFEMQGELIYNESMTIGNGGSVYTIIYTDILIIAEVIGFSVKYAPYKKIFEYIWGGEGLDPNNKLMYYAYRVTDDKRFNGAYAFSLVKGKWEVLNI